MAETRRTEFFFKKNPTWKLNNADFEDKYHKTKNFNVCRQVSWFNLKFFILHHHY
jgi:hypothetical protein